MNTATNPTDYTAVVLAAGLSSRMGAENKLALPVSGKPLLQHAIKAIVDAGIHRLIVVLGHEQDEVKACFEQEQSNHILFVTNKHYEQGQAGSITCGLRAVGDTQQATLICLGDQPLLKATHILSLIELFNERGAMQVVIPRVKGQRGNPIIISEQVRERVLKDKSNLSCRHYIDTHPEEIRWFDTSDNAYITDLDTKEDVLNFLNTEQSKR